jgi:diadenosine tetraphosphate (Ap4A) HIT family hydrolase
MVVNVRCTYCENIPGVGQKPRTVAPNLFEQPISETAKAVIVPDLGMLVPGCFLAVSKQHVFSYAHFDGDALDELDLYLQRAVDQLATVFGDYFIFEHGASEQMQNLPYGGCITHAHFHLSPVAKEVGARILNTLAFEKLPSLAAIASESNNSYALLGLKGSYFLARNPKLPGQWIRRIVVDSLGLSRHWDWGVESGDRELEVTLSMLEGHRLDI